MKFCKGDFVPFTLTIETSEEADILFAALKTATAEKQRVLPFLKPVSCDRMAREYDDIYREVRHQLES